MVRSVESVSGLRVVSEVVDSRISCCGVVVGVGSRDDVVPFSGMAHLLEHMLFKGTRGKTNVQLIQSVEQYGGEFNAYTTKESLVVYIVIQSDYVEEAISVLGDIVNNSLLDENELIKEKQIVLDEIDYYEDSPSEMIFDEFEELLFKGSPLANSILGHKKQLNKITHLDLKAFYDKYFVPSNMVFSYIGSDSEINILKLVERYFVGNSRPFQKDACIHKIDVKKFNKLKDRDTHQTHYIMGGRAFSIYEESKYALFLLSAILGGGSFNSLLNMKLREENGLTYNIESNFTPYSDSGIFNIYFGVDTKKVEQCVTLINEILLKLINNPIDERELTAYKKQYFGSLLLTFDSKVSRMIKNAKNILYYNRVITLDEIKTIVSNISPNQLQDIASQILNPNTLSTLQYD